MVDTQTTLFVFRPNHQNLVLQPLTRFSAVTPHRATTPRPRRLISATTLEMIVEEEKVPRKDRMSTASSKATSYLLDIKKQVSFLSYRSSKLLMILSPQRG
ncbi:hypothetical protein AALP_AA1G309900 [Arabis alpina]|uniref:Uncharacterized protein n=1 Tax=Arabis alpina TaxID=50452 RepID=A0A087HRU2_ARAAL|nr:hypothetical protein AALP_AA1G309900 [Arabis alpina]